jgi:hypothetical protein
LQLSKLVQDGDLSALLERRRATALGWPFDLMRPRPVPSGISYRDGTLISLLAGWWVYAITANPMSDETRMPILAYAMMAPMVAAAVRLGRYCTFYRPPISLWGRLITLRWIVGGYDKVFLAPLGIIATLALVARLWFLWGLSMQTAALIFVVLGLLIALNAAPTLDDWRLTGSHRIVPMRNRQKLIEL